MNAVVRDMPKKKAKPPAPEPGPKPTVLTMKGTLAWKGWLDRLCDYCRMPTSTVVDLALIDFARKMGFDEPPPKR